VKRPIMITNRGRLSSGGALCCGIMCIGAVRDCAAERSAAASATCQGRWRLAALQPGGETLLERSDFLMESLLFIPALLKFGRKRDSVNSTAFGRVLA